MITPTGGSPSHPSLPPSGNDPASFLNQLEQQYQSLKREFSSAQEYQFEHAIDNLMNDFKSGKITGAQALAEGHKLMDQMNVDSAANVLNGQIDVAGYKLDPEACDMLRNGLKAALNDWDSGNANAQETLQKIKEITDRLNAELQQAGG